MEVSNYQIEILNFLESLYHKEEASCLQEYEVDDILQLSENGLIAFYDCEYFITSLGRLKLAEIKEKQ